MTSEGKLILILYGGIVLFILIATVVTSIHVYLLNTKDELNWYYIDDALPQKDCAVKVIASTRIYNADDTIDTNYHTYDCFYVKEYGDFYDKNGFLVPGVVAWKQSS